MIKSVKKLLIFIGKPFYWTLSSFVIGTLIIISFVGNLTLKISKLKIKTRKAGKKKVKIKTKKVSLPELKFPKIRLPKFRLPKFKLPSLKTLLKIDLLRLNLSFLKLSSRIKKTLSKLPRFKKPRIKSRVVVTLFVVFSFLFAFWFLIFRDLPSPKDLTSRQLEVSTKIYDRNGVLLYKIFKDQNRTPVSLNNIPLHVRLATLAAEDAEFYSHLGFSIKGIIRAVIRNIERGELTGGSTITQQLVKNALLTPEKTIIRKIREIILAMQAERIYSKDQILEMYLNEVSYGGTAYGIKEGAQEYFSKDLEKITLSEAAYLAGLTKSPTKLSPYGSNPELAVERRNEVLNLMRVNKFITVEQEEEARNEEIKITPGNKDIKAPHFVMFVRQILVNKYGEDMVEKGGLEVTTTLDYEIQEMAQKIVREEVDKLKGLKVGNGASLVLNPKNGEILAMIGSKDYFDPNGGNVNVTLRLRQPGSSIKIVNYAYALAHGYTPASILDDSPTVFKVAGLPSYTPRNYDGEFRGRITLRNALAQSRNIPAVKVLASYGVSKMIEQGEKMGITTWNDPSRYGLSLTLGGGEVKLIDLANAFATIANYGKRPTITSIKKITDYKSNTLEENVCQNSQEQNGLSVSAEEKSSDCDSPQVIDPRVAYELIDILRDNNARAPEFGTHSYLVVDKHPEVAVKTGTSNDLKDNLTLGFNQDYLVAVWVGNNDSSPMSHVASGVTGASPIWNKIITSLLQDKESTAWNMPDDMIKKDCYGKIESFLKENVPNCAPIPTSTSSATMKPQILNTGASTEVSVP